MTCKDCTHATWSLTPTGRIRRDSSGDCRAPAPDLSTVKVPASDLLTLRGRHGIGPEDHPDCPTFNPRNGAPLRERK